ncbi:uncharacterized protein C12orf56 [Anabrus simplex]|uniref:uncharacterized protein C12orf56 n=1 Tax=Anabrus simplex TaxID=316456 RepID=UPI0035A2817D
MTESLSSRRNPKLEIFLKRALPRALFDDIRGYERCVVKSMRSNLTFRYVVLTGKALLLVPYPLRSAEVAVCLGDILSIRVEHDFIGFLKEPERDKCQHIHIIHKETNKSTGKEPKVEHELEEVDEEEERKKGEEEEKDISPIRENPLEETISAPGIGEEFRSLSLGVSVSRASTPKPSATGSPSHTERSISSLLRRVVTDRPRVPRSYSSMGANPDEPAPSTSLQIRSHSMLDRPRRSQRQFTEKPDVVGLFCGTRADLHIYVLHENSAFLSNLRRCWSTQLLKRTLSLSESSPLYPPVSDVTQLTNVYLQFKKDIMDSSNALEKTFHFLGELLQGLKTRPELKEIFWKDYQLYHYLVRRLHGYVKKSRRSRMGMAETKMEELHFLIQVQEEELEFVVMVLEVILASLRDTDNLDVKLKILRLEHQIRKLVAVIVAPPWLEGLFLNTCTRMLEDFTEFSSSAWKNLPEAELIRLTADVTNIVSGILFEVLVSLEQLAQNNSNMKMGHVFKDISLECYIRRAVTQLLGFLIPTQGESLTPDATVIVYQHLYVLHRLMDNIPEVLRYVQDHYMEEFRYYVKWSRVNPRILETYPVKRILEPIVDTVHGLILWRRLTTRM